LYALSVSAIGGRLLWVRTARMPLTFIAALISISTMRPLAIVDEMTLA
jgi:hypothetical protein